MLLFLFLKFRLSFSSSHFQSTRLGILETEIKVLEILETEIKVKIWETAKILETEITEIETEAETA